MFRAFRVSLCWRADTRCLLGGAGALDLLQVGQQSALGKSLQAHVRVRRPSLRKAVHARADTNDPLRFLPFRSSRPFHT